MDMYYVLCTMYYVLCNDMSFTTSKPRPHLLGRFVPRRASDGWRVYSSSLLEVTTPTPDAPRPPLLCRFVLHLTSDGWEHERDGGSLVWCSPYRVIEVAGGVARGEGGLARALRGSERGCGGARRAANAAVRFHWRSRGRALRTRRCGSVRSPPLHWRSRGRRGSRVHRCGSVHPPVVGRARVARLLPRPPTSPSSLPGVASRPGSRRALTSRRRGVSSRSARRRRRTALSRLRRIPARRRRRTALSRLRRIPARRRRRTTRSRSSSSPSRHGTSSRPCGRKATARGGGSGSRCQAGSSGRTPTTSRRTARATRRAARTTSAPPRSCATTSARRARATTTRDASATEGPGTNYRCGYRARGALWRVVRRKIARTHAEGGLYLTPETNPARAY